MVSVDTKKKEVVGNLANKGREWQPTGQPDAGRRARLPRPRDRQGHPLRRLRPRRERGVRGRRRRPRHRRVRGRHDRPLVGRGRVASPTPTPPGCSITADAGGSNGYRNRLWKVELGDLAARTGLEITVCHLPPGTSKWNKIEHRLFSAISMNWRGRPLTSHQVVVDLIAATTTRSGLKVRAHLDQGYYPPASRSPTSNSPPCPSPATPSTATGTTPSHHHPKQQPRNLLTGPYLWRQRNSPSGQRMFHRERRPEPVGAAQPAGVSYEPAVEHGRVCLREISRVLKKSWWGARVSGWGSKRMGGCVAPRTGSWRC